MFCCRTIARAIFATGAVVGISPVAYANFVPVDLSTYVDTSFSNLFNATLIPYPTGLGISGITPVPFDIADSAPPAAGGYGLNFWGGWLGSVSSPPDFGVTLAVTGLNIANVTTAFTLINNTFGGIGDNPTTITFVSTGGSITFNLIEGIQLRDYNDGVFNNVITAPTTNWFNNKGVANGSSSQQRLDQQTYDLSSLSGNITEVDITSNPICLPPIPDGDFCPPGGSFGGETTIFAGLTFQTAAPSGVPEPATLALLGLGLAGLGFSRRKQ